MRFAAIFRAKNNRWKISCMVNGIFLFVRIHIHSFGHFFLPNAYQAVLDPFWSIYFRDEKNENTESYNTNKSLKLSV